MRACEFCGRSIVQKNAQARFCSDKCRNYFRRAIARTTVPTAMAQRDRWIRWDRIMWKGVLDKKPLTLTGRFASSTDADTWSSYLDASKSSVGIGLGYALGAGIGCLDLDHCLVEGVPTSATKAMLSRYPRHFIEVSPSGDGLHIWGFADEAPGTRRTIDGVSVERYTVSRWMTVTGNIFQHGDLLPL